MSDELKRAVVVVCATELDMLLTGRVTGREQRADCARCGAKLLMTSTAQIPPGETPIPLCQPCAKIALAQVHAAGKPIETRISDAAQRTIDKSPAARQRLNDVLRAAGKEPEK